MEETDSALFLKIFGLGEKRIPTWENKVSAKKQLKELTSYANWRGQLLSLEKSEPLQFLMRLETFPKRNN